MTHCAFITPHAALQVAPQVLIGSKSRFTLRVLIRLGKIPSAIYIIRGRIRGTMEVSCMLQVLEGLSKACAKFPSLQPILLMGVCRSHFGAQVLEEARRLGFLVSVALTWLLQPLIFYAFASTKIFLNQNSETV